MVGVVQSPMFFSLLDTGSPSSFVRMSVVRSAMPCLRIEDRRVFVLRGVGNGRMKAYEGVMAEIQLAGKRRSLRLYVVPDDCVPNDLILGRDFLYITVHG